MPKINLRENIKKLKSQLESGLNLADYFLVAGISPKNCKDNFLYQIKNKNYISKFKEKLKPNIISRFPSFDNAIDTIDEEIVNFCFPDGFEPIFSNSKSIENKYFSVILDNNLFSAEHPQKYLTCLLFYEKLSQYKKLKYIIEGKSYEKDPDCRDEDEINVNNYYSNNNEEEKNIIIPNSTTVNNFESTFSTASLQVNFLNSNSNMAKDKDELFKSLVITGRKHSVVSNAVASIKNVFIPKCICLV